MTQFTHDNYFGGEQKIVPNQFTHTHTHTATQLTTNGSDVSSCHINKMRIAVGSLSPKHTNEKKIPKNWKQFCANHVTVTSWRYLFDRIVDPPDLMQFFAIRQSIGMEGIVVSWSHWSMNASAIVRERICLRFSASAVLPYYCVSYVVAKLFINCLRVTRVLFHLVLWTRIHYTHSYTFNISHIK